MVDRRRDVKRTLPTIGGLTDEDEVVISYDLFIPGRNDRVDLIGSLEVTVDRSIVAEGVVNRLLLYFLLACFKNFLLGFVLVFVVYVSLARYIVAFANNVQTGQPGENPLALPALPRLFSDTEIAVFADRISFLASKVGNTISDMEKTVDERTAMLERERELSGLQRQFVSMVCHAFRTPLAIIDGNAQRLHRRADKITPEKLRETLGKVRTSVGRLTDLMESVLSAARLEAGTINFEPQPCCPADMITEVVANYSELNPGYQLTMTVDNLPLTFSMDGKLIRQVLSNLISNAIKYAPEDTSVWIDGERTEDGGIMIAVRDEGVWIPAEEIERLFERFFRASTSTGIAGTGIDLHMVKALVDMHNGRIDVVSEEGKGTTFSFHLPPPEEDHETIDAEDVPVEAMLA